MKPKIAPAPSSRAAQSLGQLAGVNEQRDSELYMASFTLCYKKCKGYLAICYGHKELFAL